MEQGVLAGARLGKALPGAILSELHATLAHRLGGLDSRGPAAGALSDPAAQSPVGRCAGEMKPAVVLLSGGLDSATTLAIAHSQSFQSYALSVHYGQRHEAELLAAKRVARFLGAHEHRVMSVDLAAIGGSALTDKNVAVPEQP